MEKVCPMYEKCPLLPTLSEKEREEVVKKYCKGDFESCARKKSKTAEKCRLQTLCRTVRWSRNSISPT
ncbi:MAG: hypothetical protein J7L03_00665 [Caldisericaceae bacterium]|nr:hypothetical protein [Caldisericaceae bacterium]